MANHPSAAKRNRQRIKRTARNRAIRSALKTSLKSARAAIESGDLNSAKELVATASKTLARAASKGTIRLSNAARTTSRLASALTKLVG
jgi:small subunit ribosomal protein S20